MQSNVGSPKGTVTAFFTYAARYGYSDNVIQSDNQLRIFPREGDGQSAPEAEVWSIPSGRGVDFRDRFGNRVRRLRVIEPHSTFVVAAAGKVELSTECPSKEDATVSDLQALPETYEYIALSPLVDPEKVAHAAKEALGALNEDSLLTAVSAVTSWVHEGIVYKRGTTSVATTAEQVLRNGSGVCQDKTHLALGMLRALKVPCRYASGLIAGQSGETHSWLEFLHPRNGWLGADPTRGLILRPSSEYVKFGVGRDYTDVSPVTGSFLSSGVAADVAAIADVQFTERRATLQDALAMLENAFVVENQGAAVVDSPDSLERDL